MKHYTFLLLLTFLQLTAICQIEGTKKIPEKLGDKILAQQNKQQTDTSETQDDATEIIQPKVNRKITFGVSLGYSRVFDDLKEARISPIDNKLYVTDLNKSSFLLSTSVVIPVSRGRLGGSYYQKLDRQGVPYGDYYYVPSGLYFVATVNLINFNSAADGSLFNKKLDGGLGLGLRASEDFLISATYEMISYRQPRDFLLESFTGKEINIDGKPLTALTEDDNNYFRDKYMPSISLKFIYLFGGNRIKNN